MTKLLLICLQFVLCVGTIAQSQNAGNPFGITIGPPNEALATARPPIVILVLGCHIPEIQEARLQAAIEFANNQDKTRALTWFLSGGIKDNMRRMRTSDASEASTMAEKITDNPNWKIQLDTKATNTAENFAAFAKWINIQPLSDIYVATSEFHHERAAIIFDGIINIETKWILSQKVCRHCVSDERIHIGNVANDIKNGLFLYNEL